MRYILLLLTLGTCLVQAQTKPAILALRDVTLIDANHRSGLPHQTIIVSGKKIVKIFKEGALPMPDSCTVIDLAGKYVIPGLVDTHVHLATDPSGVDNRTATLDVLQRMLYSGITSVRDMAGDARTHASTAGLSAGQTPYMRAVTDSTDLIRAVAEAKGTGATGIKLYADLDASLVAKICDRGEEAGIACLGACLVTSGETDRTGSGRGEIHLSCAAVDL